MCLWAQFDAWERQVYALWQLCSAGEGWIHPDTKDHRVRFHVDPVLYAELRASGHPAFGSPAVEPWEVLECLKDIAGLLSEDPNTQQRVTRNRR